MIGEILYKTPIQTDLLKTIDEDNPNDLSTLIIIKNEIQKDEIHNLITQLLFKYKLHTNFYIPLMDMFKRFIKNTSKDTIQKLSDLLLRNPYRITDVNTLDITDINNYYSHYFYSDFFNELINIKDITVGKGELYLMILTNITNSDGHGDLSLDNLHIELKADLGRLRHAFGYNTAISGFEYFKEQLQKKVSLDFKQPTKWNYSYSNTQHVLDKYNLIINIVGFDKFKSIIINMFKKMYYKIKTEYIDIFINQIFINETLCSSDDFMKYFFELQFSYYKQLTIFDYLVILNIKKNKIIFIKDINDLNSKYHLLSLTSFSWTQDRNVAFCINIK